MVLQSWQGQYPRTVKMQIITKFPLDLLKTILIFLATSSDGASDLARAICTCKIFKNAAEDLVVLTSVNFQNVKLNGRSELFHHINGLFSRCAQAGNEAAKYFLAKTILLGSSPLWSRMLENGNLQYSIDQGFTVTDSIIDQPFSSNASLGCLHHSSLVRSFLCTFSLDDDNIVLVCSHLEGYVKYLVGSQEAHYRRIFDNINLMCLLCEIIERSMRNLEKLNDEIEDELHTSDEIIGVDKTKMLVFELDLVMPARVKYFEFCRARAILDFDCLFPPRHI